MTAKIQYRGRTIALVGVMFIAIIGIVGVVRYSFRQRIEELAPPLPQISPVSLPITFEPSIHAAELANDKCEQEFGLRPFQADTFKLSFADERYEWGRLDPIGVKGYSAKVTFNREGRDALVSVYWSVDMLDEFEVSAFSVTEEGGALKLEGLTNSIKPD